MALQVRRRVGRHGDRAVTRTARISAASRCSRWPGKPAVCETLDVHLGSPAAPHVRRPPRRSRSTRPGTWCTAGRSPTSWPARRWRAARRPTPGSSSRPSRTWPKRYPWPLSAFERAAMTRARRLDRVRETVRDTLAARPGLCRQAVAGDSPRRRRDPFCPDAGSAPADPRSARMVAGRPRGAGSSDGSCLKRGLAPFWRRCARVTTPWRALFVGGGPMEDHRSGDLPQQHPAACTSKRACPTTPCRTG